MAGKKKTSATTETKGEKTLAEKLAALDDICKGAVENGLAVAGRLSDPSISEFLTIKWIPTPSDDVNELLGGGVPRGKVTIISGAPDVGKTKLAEQTIAEGMKNDPNFVAVWMEAENSMNKKSMVEDGIDPNRLHFFSQNKQAAAEGIADTLFAILSADIKPDVVVINSLKMLVPKNEMTKSMEKVSVAEQARFNARLMNRIVPMLAENNTALIIIQHLTTNIGQMFGN